MNIKQFLLFKACDVLPSELKYYIYDIVKYDAVCSIQNLYTLKVKKNVDIFMKLMDFCDDYSYTYSPIYCDHVEYFLLHYAVKNATYKYIQEPAAWVNYLDNIINMYFWDKANHEVNVIYYMMNSIINSSEMYNNSRITYWDNF